MTEVEWAALLRAANAGDARAYRRFLHAITPMLRGLVRARGGSLGAEHCEDIVQEVLLAIHLKRHTWRSDAPLRPWLYAIARHKVIDAFRARGQRVDLPLGDFAELIAADPGPDPTEASDALRMIERLDPRSAEIVRAIGIDGEEIAETSRRLEMTEGAVRVVLHRAFKRLAALRERHIE
ncbi:sigma-70 family RNA polymerase sigma factor [Frigidibacter albus]|uniref:Sigma-70 family RNA polymerase sigma factor n=1 Tax=Frigidibacter albus TaxID=1465486 RepID=A0A6L8VKT3_9RHOB|nr:sigma-70 family RNA polymerase sigma factor [Frigidibacter albus]MZQ89989.1 sigma-70 family RNA polymerase sigma factor [Frigidibacter albus]NBE31897.1 sigma-70 family RNA polymerase sigma factor [Frigidibacter albus]GGH57959.1 RNA polymerase sigma factor [Frigidibacter albus]